MEKVDLEDFYTKILRDYLPGVFPKFKCDESKFVQGSNARVFEGYGSADSFRHGVSDLAVRISMPGSSSVWNTMVFKNSLTLTFVETCCLWLFLSDATPEGVKAWYVRSHINYQHPYFPIEVLITRRGACSLLAELRSRKSESRGFTVAEVVAFAHDLLGAVTKLHAVRIPAGAVPELESRVKDDTALPEQLESRSSALDDDTTSLLVRHSMLTARGFVKDPIDYSPKFFF